MEEPDFNGWLKTDEGKILTGLVMQGHAQVSTLTLYLENIIFICFNAGQKFGIQEERRRIRAAIMKEIG